nr:rRNA maturation RNase YbeY [Desulfovibrio legallii]
MFRAARQNPRVPAPPCGVDLHILDDAGISAANRRFLGCVGPTNVLSFPGDAAMPGALLLSLDTLRRECLLYGQEPVEHCLRLLAHGMGHLCGLDHGPLMDALCADFAAAAAAALEGKEGIFPRRFRGLAP